MTNVCMYVQVHQPYRLSAYRVLDIGRRGDYFDEDGNREIVQRIAAKCYLPANEVLLRQIERFQGRFRIAFSISGTALEQFERHAPQALLSFRDLARTGCVEFLGETAMHSLAGILDAAEFRRQVDLHLNMTEHWFGRRPTTFRNTELIYNNDLAATIRQRGFTAMLAEGAESTLGWRSPDFVYSAPGTPGTTGNTGTIENTGNTGNTANAAAPGLSVLLRNYRLSDDIAFRFSNRAWPEWPLTAGKYAQWINAINGNGQVVNLFMDYETFGEHHWADTGIFDFLAALPGAVLAHPDNRFLTPAQVAASCPPVGEIDVPGHTSWADQERDLSAWLGNAMQRSAAQALYDLAEPVHRSGDPRMIRTWRRLTTSDHLYYMSTKRMSDGEVHAYFNPYESPYEAYIRFMNVLHDLSLRLKETPASVPGAVPMRTMLSRLQDRAIIDSTRAVEPMAAAV